MRTAEDEKPAPAADDDRPPIEDDDFAGAHRHLERVIESDTVPEESRSLLSKSNGVAAGSASFPISALRIDESNSNTNPNHNSMITPRSALRGSGAAATPTAAGGASGAGGGGGGDFTPRKAVKFVSRETDSLLKSSLLARTPAQRVAMCLAASGVKDALHAKDTLLHNAHRYKRLPLERVESIVRVHTLILHPHIRSIMLCIAWLHLSLVLFEAPTAALWTAPNWLTAGAELLFLSCHAAHAYARHYTGELRGSRIAVPFLVGFVSIADTAISLYAGSSYPRIAAKFCRPFFFIRYSRLLKESMETCVEVLRAVYKYFLMLASFVVTYGMCAWLLFQHIDPDNFGTFGRSVLNMTYLLTASNFPDITFVVDDYSSASVIFFVTYVMMGIVFLLNLVLAVVYKSYNAAFKQTLINKVERVDKSLAGAFKLLANPKTNTIDHATWMALCDAVRPDYSYTHCQALWYAMDADGSGSLDAEEFRRLVQFFDGRFSEPLCAVRCDTRGLARIQTQILEFVSTSIYVPRISLFDLCFRAEDDIRMQNAETGHRQRAKQIAHARRIAQVIRNSKSVDATAGGSGAAIAAPLTSSEVPGPLPRRHTTSEVTTSAAPVPPPQQPAALGEPKRTPPLRPAAGTNPNPTPPASTKKQRAFAFNLLEAKPGSTPVAGTPDAAAATAAAGGASGARPPPAHPSPHVGSTRPRAVPGSGLTSPSHRSLVVAPSPRSASAGFGVARALAASPAAAPSPRVHAPSPYFIPERPVIPLLALPALAPTPRSAAASAAAAAASAAAANTAAAALAGEDDSDTDDADDTLAAIAATGESPVKPPRRALSDGNAPAAAVPDKAAEDGSDDDDDGDGEPDLNRFVQIYVFELLVNVALSMQATALVLDGLGYVEWWSVRLVCIIFFALESILKLCAYGFTWRHAPLPIIDCMITLVSVLGQIFVPEYYILWQSIQLFRLARMFFPMHGIMRSYEQTMRTCFPVLGVLFFLMYEFAVIGVWQFNGLLTPDRIDPNSPYAASGYWSLNFDTFPNAFFTLFSCVINNWTVVTSGVVDAVGPTGYVYFILYFVLGVQVMLNVIIAFTLDTFGLFSDPDATDEPTKDDAPVEPQLPAKQSGSRSPPPPAGAGAGAGAGISGGAAGIAGRLLNHPPKPAATAGAAAGAVGAAVATRDDESRLSAALALAASDTGAGAGSDSKTSNAAGSLSLSLPPPSPSGSSGAGGGAAAAAAAAGGDARARMRTYSFGSRLSLVQREQITRHRNAIQKLRRRQSEVFNFLLEASAREGFPLDEGVLETRRKHHSKLIRLLGDDDHTLRSKIKLFSGVQFH